MFSALNSLFWGRVYALLRFPSVSPEVLWTTLYCTMMVLQMGVCQQEPHEPAACTSDELCAIVFGLLCKGAWKTVLGKCATAKSRGSSPDLLGIVRDVFWVLAAPAGHRRKLLTVTSHSAPSFLECAMALSFAASRSFVACEGRTSMRS